MAARRHELPLRRGHLPVVRTWRTAGVAGTNHVPLAGVVKIGRTTRSAELQSAGLFTTGVPKPFQVGAAYEVVDGAAVEGANFSE
jgi:hypothetical protein